VATAADLRFLRRRAGAVILRRRRWIAAALAAFAVAAALQALSPPATALSAVVVAAHALPGGHSLSATDLRTEQLPTADVPAGSSASAATLVGRTTAGPVEAGAPITDVGLLGPALTRQLAPGQVAVPVPLADAIIGAVLRTGEVIDIVASDPAVPSVAGGAPASARVVAHGLTILAPPVAAADGSSSVLVVAADRSQAVALSAAVETSALTAVLDPAS
jgi:Flp pilus assembly protein CpaB